MNRNISPQQQKVLDFMVVFFLMNDQLPGSPAIAKAFGYASPNAASEIVLRLAVKGFLEKNEAGNYRFNRVRMQAQPLAVTMSAAGGAA